MSENQMWATVFMAPGELSFRQMPIPAVGPEDILVKINTGLTCGTDVKTYKRGHPKVYDPPVLFGHEFAGDVVEVGEAVEKIEVGMRVVAGNSAPCNECYFCKRGQPNICDDLINNWGAFAEYILVPGRLVRQNTMILPDHVSYRQAAITEPLACVVHGQDLLHIQPGESVAIIGAGPIGLMHLQLALRQGAAPVMMIDLNDMRLGIAEKLGASRVINSAQVEPVEAVRELTEGRGADVVIECAGVKAAWLTALDVARKGGRVEWFGGLPGGEQVTVDSTRVHYDELTLYGVFHLSPHSLERAFHLISTGLIDADALITHEVPLKDLEDGLRMMMEGRSLKVAVLP